MKLNSVPLLLRTSLCYPTVYTRHLLHQTTFTPDTVHTRHLLHQDFYTRHLLHRKLFIPGTSSPDNFCTNQLLHQTPFTPTSFYTFYTRHLLHQATFRPDTFYTNRLSHQTTWQLYFSLVFLFWAPLQQNSGHYIPYVTCFFPQPEKPKSIVPVFSRKIGNSTFHWLTSSGPLCSKTYALHNPKHVIPSTCTRQEYSSSLLHQSLFAPIFTRHHLHQTTFLPGTSSPETFDTRHLLHQTHFTRGTFYTRHLLHQPTFTPDNIHTRYLLHQPTFTPDNFRTRQFLHQPTFTPDNFYTNQPLHQAPFTPDNFHTRQFLHQPTFTPDNFYTRHLLHQTPCTQMRMLASQRLEIALCIFKIFTFLGTNGFQNIDIFGYQCFSKY